MAGALVDRVPRRLIVLAIAVAVAPVGLAQQPSGAAMMTLSVTTGAEASGPDAVGAAARRSVPRDSYEALYQLAVSAKGTSIAASMPYLALVAAGGPIYPISYTWEPFRWGFPNLVMQVTNNRATPLALTRAVFTVKKSALDPTPIPVIRPDTFRSNARHVLVTNEGWGDLGNAELAFNLLPLAGNPSRRDYDGPFAHTIKVGSLAERSNVDVSAAFIDEGIDFSKFPDSRGRRLPDDSPWFGKFKGGGARLVGQLRFVAHRVDGRTEPRAVKLAVEVWLYNEDLVGVPRPPGYDYEMKFEVTGTNYVVNVPITRTIGAGRRETISIRLGALKSSVHDFAVSLRSPDAAVESPLVHLELFIPRSGAKYIQGR